MLLDNPIYNSLTTIDADKNIGTNDFTWLDAAIAPFMGMADWNKTKQRELLDVAPKGRSWFLLIAGEVEFIPEWEVTLAIPLFQFHCPDPGKVPQKKNHDHIVPLDKSHVEEMVALTALTKPGPFRERTIEFGNYHGIFENGKLVAMGGERLHLPGLSEVSAICTHPDHQGKGYGNSIVNFLTHDIHKRGLTPFLHARTDNLGAMEVYKKQGYEVRREIMFYVFRLPVDQ